MACLLRQRRRAESLETAPGLRRSCEEVCLWYGVSLLSKAVWLGPEVSLGADNELIGVTLGSLRLQMSDCGKGWLAVLCVLRHRRWCLYCVELALGKSAVAVKNNLSPWGTRKRRQWLIS